MSELAVEAAPEAPADPVDPDTPEPDPVAEESAPDPEPEPAPAAFDYDAPEFQEAVARTAQQQHDAWLAEQNREPEPDLNAGIAALDPLAEDFGQQLAAALEERDQKLFERFQSTPAAQHADQAYVEKWADEQFAGIEGTLGTKLDDTDRGLAIAAAVGLADQLGGDPRTLPERALAEGARRIHARIDAERTAAVEAYKASLLGDGDAPHEPGPGAAASIRLETKAKSYDDVLAKYGYA